MYAIIIDNWNDNCHYDQDVEIINDKHAMRKFCLNQIIYFIKQNFKFIEGTIYDDTNYKKLFKYANAEIRSDEKN